MKHYTLQSFSDNQDWPDEDYTNLSTACKEARENVSNGANWARVVSGELDHPCPLTHYTTNADIKGGQFCSCRQSVKGSWI